MAALQSVPVYQIDSNNKLISPLPTYIGLGSAQMQSVQGVSGAPNNINGALVYTEITMNGNVQNPGHIYYTSLTVAAIIAAS
jgi:hypothetical protein